MNSLQNNVKQEIDKLKGIAKKYRDGNISESLFLDVMSKYRNDKDIIIKSKEYLYSQGIEIISYESETDDEEECDEGISIKPYDTKLIDISPKPLSLDTIISRLDNDEIDLMPDFQRKAGLWTEKQKSQLIESLILRIPLPAFYFDGSDNDLWIVIDGLQRLTAIKEFFVKKTLCLSELEFLKDLEGVGYTDLPRSYIRRMKETQIITYIINPGAPINLKYNIFKRINTGGLELEPQEIRHALYQGFATDYLKQLASLESFKTSTGYSVHTERMLDREFALRFIAFYEFSVERYSGSIDFFLNDAMDYINRKYDDHHANKVERIFELSLDTSKEIFGKYAFRRMPDMEKRRPISKALFETWTSILAKHSIDDLQLLTERKEIIIDKYVDLCANNAEFLHSISGGKISDYKKRFEIINTLVEEVLQND